MPTTVDRKDEPTLKVVSLLGAATEVIYRLGLGHLLVGRSHECDYPRAALSLPCISRPRLDVDSSSANIDATVREHSAAGEPIYKLDDDVLESLQPDLLIAQDHCRVCAVTPGDVGKSSCANVRQLVLRPATLNDCIEDVVKIANELGVPERGLSLRSTMVSRMDRVKELTIAASTKKPRVALLEWCDPIMGCGYWLPELVDVAGGMALHCPPPGGATPTISFQTLLESKPDVVVFALCGFGLVRAASEIKSSWGQEKINELKEICHGQIYIVDGNYLINRSGPRVVESCEALAEAIHSNLQGHFGHFGTDLLTTFDNAMTMVEAGEKTGSEKIRPAPLSEPKVKSTIRLNTNNVMPTMDPAEIVKLQLQSLQTGEYEKAFGMNSTANQDRWCGSERFVAVLKSHSDFKRLLVKDNGVTVTLDAIKEDEGKIATVKVSLPITEGNAAVKLLWTMVAETSNSSKEVVWRTEKVGMAH